ncbi:hypothetical protein RHSIM_Rhsim04G0101300 [Rhododendron simsii]|uniref:Uncharacterized protein n=1 Tax=Rhododendron simsii TaxID=118357 RepID=A0A834LQX0_RHOSS|nr:hypothetical protein RHSIM_Rhsim04G0101300 [Rhododendron simsii]
MYPLAEEVLPFESQCLDWNRFSIAIPNQLWHRPVAKYVEWLDRMLEAKEKPRSPVIDPTPMVDPPVEPEFINMPDEEEDEDLDSLFKSA